VRSAARGPQDDSTVHPAFETVPNPLFRSSGMAAPGNARGVVTTSLWDEHSFLPLLRRIGQEVLDNLSRTRASPFFRTLKSYSARAADLQRCRISLCFIGNRALLLVVSSVQISMSSHSSFRGVGGRFRPMGQTRFDQLIGDRTTRELVREYMKHALGSEAAEWVKAGLQVKLVEDVQHSLDGLSAMIAGASRSSRWIGIGLIVVGSATWVLVILRIFEICGWVR